MKVLSYSIKHFVSPLKCHQEEKKFTDDGNRYGKFFYNFNRSEKDNEFDNTKLSSASINNQLLSCDGKI